MRFGEIVPAALGAVIEFLADDVVAKLDALVAYEYGGACDQFADFVLALPAKRAVKQLTVVGFAARIVSHVRSFRPSWKFVLAL